MEKKGDAEVKKTGRTETRQRHRQMSNTKMSSTKKSRAWICSRDVQRHDYGNGGGHDKEMRTSWQMKEREETNTRHATLEKEQDHSRAERVAGPGSSRV